MLAESGYLFENPNILVLWLRVVDPIQFLLTAALA